jgi:CRP-like cAMP-binding protein
MKQELFEGILAEDRARIDALASSVDYPADHIVVHDNEPGDAVYLVEEGAVVVTKRSRDCQLELLNILTQGDYFGEMALLNVMPYSATVTTIEPTRLSKIPHEDLRKLIEANPQIGSVMFRNFALTLSGRLRQLTEKFDALAHRGWEGTRTEPTEDITRFVSSVLQTPATIVKGMTDVLGESLLSKNDQDYYLRMIQEQAGRVINAVKGRLDER